MDYRDCCFKKCTVHRQSYQAGTKVVKVCKSLFMQDAIHLRVGPVQGEKKTKLDKVYKRFKVKVTLKQMAYHCSKFNAYC